MDGAREGRFLTRRRVLRLGRTMDSKKLSEATHGASVGHPVAALSSAAGRDASAGGIFLPPVPHLFPIIPLDPSGHLVRVRFKNF